MSLSRATILSIGKKFGEPRALGFSGPSWSSFREVAIHNEGSILRISGYWSTVETVHLKRKHKILLTATKIGF